MLAAKRADEIRQGLQTWFGMGHEAVFLTLTLGHVNKAKLTLGAIGKVLTDSWGRLQQQPWWRAMRAEDQAGMEGFVRCLEATVRLEKGWHAHLHVVLFVKDASAVLARRTQVFTAWKRLVEKNPGYQVEASVEAGAQDMRPIDRDEDVADKIGGYLTKSESRWGVGQEMAMWTAKKAAGEAFAPIDLLQAFLDTGDLDLLDLWHDWETGMKRKHMIQWSLGLKDRLGVEDVKDAEILDNMPDGMEDDDVERFDIDRGTQEVAGLTAAEWHKVRSGRIELVPLELVENAENGEQALDALAHFAEVNDLEMVIGQEWTSKHLEAQRDRDLFFTELAPKIAENRRWAEGKALPEFREKAAKAIRSMEMSESERIETEN